jgi:c-di-GMP-binding flagellar brake protein YcgR
MAAWLTKIMGALAGQSETKSTARQALDSAQRDRIKIALEVISPGSNHSTVYSTTIEQVRDEDLVINQPSVGGLTHPLAFGETLRMSFILNSMHYSAETRCMGRVKIPSGSGSQLLFAYRLAMPETIRSEDRRASPRVSLGDDLAFEAQLYAPTCDGPMLATVLDLSMGGARVRTPMALGKLEPGQEVYLKTMLPEPVGLLDELVQVERIENEQRGVPGQIIGLSFKRRIEGLAELIRTAQLRVTRRKAG